jgi:hypothetical protein
MVFDILSTEVNPEYSKAGTLAPKPDLVVTMITPVLPLVP